MSKAQESYHEGSWNELHPPKSWKRVRAFGWDDKKGWGYHRMYLLFNGSKQEIGYYDHKAKAKRWAAR